MAGLLPQVLRGAAGGIILHRAWWGNASLLALYALLFWLAHDAGDGGTASAAVLGVAVIALAAWVGNLRRRQLINDTPTSRIASSAQGYTELHGHAKQFPGHILPARLSGLPCVWYRYQVETLGVRGDWRVVEYGVSDETFLLEDGSGRCIVDPEGAEVLTSRKRVWLEGEKRHTEWLIQPGDELYALGEFTTLLPRVSTEELRLDLGTLLAEWKRDQRGLLARFDSDGDGRLDALEWEKVRAAARTEIEARERERAAAGPLHLLRKPRDGRPFLLSNVAPERLARRYGRWAWIHLAAFLAACAVLAALPVR